ncbi:MAG: chromosome segregation SMC family protein [Patescibacteria group bacterium]|jgi:chromosome segregation protein
MYLAKLELQGFKTFAGKTTLLFPGQKDGGYSVTTIVGPNGSGKSNLADAIRWALGEQSLKLLRGKNSEDVIFSGSANKSRSGFAEVNLTFDNSDHVVPVDFSEVVITRKLYRDGESEYLVNGSTARLSDIRLMLAEANVGQQSYSVIGQGMVDHILVATPEERKAFFDDAMGVKPLQLKRHDAILKLKRTAENLSEVKMLLMEIEPRLKSLKRQANRLEKRAIIETELKDLRQRYYSSLWWSLHDQSVSVRDKHDKMEGAVGRVIERVKDLETKVSTKEAEERGKEKTNAGLLALQKEYQETQRERARLRDEEFVVERQIELTKVKAETTWAPLPLSKIIEEVENIKVSQKGLVAALRAAKSMDDVKKIADEAETVFDRSSLLVSRLQKPTPIEAKPDPALVAKREKIKIERLGIENKLVELEKSINTSASQEKTDRTELFAMHRELRQAEEERHHLEADWHETQIELARLEEREKNLDREIQEEMGAEAMTSKSNRPTGQINTDELYPEIQRLRYQLELIGGIDPETLKEYESTNERFTFLSAQTEDLEKAIRDTEKVIDELDEKIKEQSEEAFKKINKEFSKFFKMLFGGGSCELVKLTVEDLAPEESEVSLERALNDTAETEQIKEERPIFVEKKDRVIGVDIYATPPGKKLKSLNLLSGGERALTSIALVSAIMATNPAPFVVLDEVDAALDEANTVRFASILDELAKLTQFIVITHNRATMEKADVLYGVTMGEEGTSKVLSVRLENVAGGNGTARR